MPATTYPSLLSPPPPHHPPSSSQLVRSSTRDGDGAALDLTTAGALGLDLPHELLAVLVSDLAEDDVLAVQPAGDDGGDEELGAVGVGPGVGHAEEEGLGVLELEVFVRELLAVDGLAARALDIIKR